MEHSEVTRRTIVWSLAALPATALLFRPDVAAAQVGRMVLFRGVQANAPTAGPATHVFGWAAETPQGWGGLVTDWNVATARREFPGFAAGATMTVPEVTPNTVNGHTSQEGVRFTGTCFSDVAGVTVMGSYFKLTGVLRQAENPLIFVLGDPISVEGNADAGEFTFTIRAAGQDRPTNLRGQILISSSLAAPAPVQISR